MDDFEKSIKLLNLAGYETIEELIGNNWCQVTLKKGKNPAVWLFKDEEIESTIYDREELAGAWDVVRWSLVSTELSTYMSRWISEHAEDIFIHGVKMALDVIYQHAIDKGLIDE